MIVCNNGDEYGSCKKLTFSHKHKLIGSDAEKTNRLYELKTDHEINNLENFVADGQMSDVMYRHFCCGPVLLLIHNRANNVWQNAMEKIFAHKLYTYTIVQMLL